MDVFSMILADILFLLIGLVGSAAAFWLYNRFPPAWFCEDGDFSKAGREPDMVPDPRMKRFPDGVWYCSILVFILFLFYIQYGLSPAFLCSLLSLVFFSFVFVADQKTGIIPDQFIAGLLFVSLLWMVNDFHFLQETGDAWYRNILMRILGGIAGSAILFGIGWIGARIFKEEAMGMGDVKLAFACGVLVGWSSVLWVLGLAFLFAFFPALAQLLHVRKEQRRHIPFGPFITVAATLCILFPSEFELLVLWYRQLM